ncbi:MAG: hypothetical protein Phyf2KO_11300 [Phycisphaerales bacterium]
MSEFPTQSQLVIVLVDDNIDHLELLAQSIASTRASDEEQIRIKKYSDPGEALADLPVADDAIIFLDYQLGSESGVDWVSDFVRTGAGPVIVVTSSGDENVAANAFRQGASDYIVKDVAFDDSETLRRSIREARRRHHLETANCELNRRMKSLNSALQHKNVCLGEATATAHRFVDNVAHEFRTPLTVIREFASILTDGIGGSVSAKQTEFLQYIIEAANDLSMLVDDFLDSGKLRAQTLRVRRCSCAVSEIIQSAMPLLVPRARAKGVSLTLKIPTELPLVYADIEKAKRTLVNLVINAIKFSGEGSRVLVQAERVSHNTVMMSVVDEGPGLSEQERTAIFGRFSQGDCGKQSNSKGFGLGLSIAEELAHINLGTIGATSTPGQGSTFYFTLPPATLEAVLESYVNQVSASCDEATVAAICAKDREINEPGELLHSLSAHSHAMDLVLPSRQPGVGYLIGETTDVSAWVDRLQQAMQGSSGRAIELSPVGAWSVGTTLESIQELAGELQLEHSDEANHSHC